MNETTERFFQEIADRVGYDRVAEVHLFPPIRQGGVESGLAVVAATQEPFGSELPEATSPEAASFPDTEPLEEASTDVAPAEPPPRESPPPEPLPITRHVVYAARYRAVLKGPDRGKWEIDVKAEADAPLLTVDEVVRGVVRRSGDDFTPERITGEQFRAIVPAPAAPPAVPASPEPDGTPRQDSAPV